MTALEGVEDGPEMDKKKVDKCRTLITRIPDSTLLQSLKMIHVTSDMWTWKLAFMFCQLAFRIYLSMY